MDYYPIKTLEVPRRTSRQISLGEDWLADTLLRRGFPVVIENDGLRLCGGAWPEDVGFLEKKTASFDPSS